MKGNYFRSLPEFSSTQLKVDRENGVLRETCIAKPGKNLNGSYFDDAFLSDLVSSGNLGEGIKSRFGHPNMCSTSFGTFIGRYKNFKTTDGLVFADLHLDPITKKTQVEGKGISMFDYIMDMAETNPDMFGNSIHIYSEVYEMEIDGKMETLHKLEKFKACDLVDDPAATDSLFSDGQDLGILVTRFLDENPKIFSVIEKDPKILETFFDRYINYSTRKSLINFNMNFLDNLKKKFSSKKEGETFDIDLTLASGDIVTVITEAEEPKEGDKVVDAEGKAVEDDTHLLPDGSGVTTVDGVITAFVDAPTEEEPEAGSNEAVMAAIGRLSAQFETFQKAHKKSQKDVETAFELIGDNFQTLEGKFNKLAKGVKSKYDVETESEIKAKKKGSSVYDPEKAKAAREARNK